ncbi:hypothetical protein H2248_010174 [Termitomyces sp. 'cryptogamus']|nr:hypothetical protein H2248_010174 [Termitomyces sp. 'cryptogamus']
MHVPLKIRVGGIIVRDTANILLIETMQKVIPSSFNEVLVYDELDKISGANIDENVVMTLSGMNAKVI